MFFNFDQNNSGGYFLTDDNAGVSEYVIVEAPDADEAVRRFKLIGESVPGFWNFCGCCGERWSTWVDDDEGTKQPEIYGETLDKCKAGMFRKKVYVHWETKDFERFDLQS